MPHTAKFHIFAKSSVASMKTEVHGITKTRIEFLSNEIQTRVLLPDGDAFIVSFPSANNFHSGGHFIKLLARLFDMYAGTAKRVTEQTVKKINAELYLSDYEMIVHIIPDLDKGEERIRIGQRIKQLRKENNIDAKTLAARAGIDPSNLSRIELGHYSVGFDMLNKIANALGARVELVKYQSPTTPSQNTKPGQQAE